MRATVCRGASAEPTSRVIAPQDVSRARNERPASLMTVMSRAHPRSSLERRRTDDQGAGAVGFDRAAASNIGRPRVVSPRRPITSHHECGSNVPCLGQRWCSPSCRERGTGVLYGHRAIEWECGTSVPCRHQWRGRQRGSAVPFFPTEVLLRVRNERLRWRASNGQDVDNLWVMCGYAAVLGLGRQRLFAGPTARARGGDGCGRSDDGRGRGDDGHRRDREPLRHAG